MLNSVCPIWTHRLALTNWAKWLSGACSPSDFPDVVSSKNSVPTQGPHHVAVMAVRVTIGSSRVLRGADPRGIRRWSEAQRAVVPTVSRSKAC